jgi:hypothetical protein
VYEWAFDGTLITSYDFAPGGECDGAAGSAGPCVHHDAFKSDVSGRTYVLSSTQSARDAIGTAWEDRCGTDSRFVDDGITTLSRTGTLLGAKYLMTDYGFDPAEYGGPNEEEVVAYGRACDGLTYRFDFEFGAMDWTHSNNITATKFGPVEILDFSLKEWDAIVRFQASTGAHLSTLSPHADISSWTLGIAEGIQGPATFKAQHDSHEIGVNQLLLYDNLGDPVGARVIRFVTDLDADTATIDRSWVLVDQDGTPLSCPIEGSGQLVPGSGGENVLANCNDENTIVELDDWTGNTGTAPPLVISLPDEDYCADDTGPRNRQNILGWHKAFPAVSVGAF